MQKTTKVLLSFGAISIISAPILTIACNNSIKTNNQAEVEAKVLKVSLNKPTNDKDKTWDSKPFINRLNQEIASLIEQFNLKNNKKPLELFKIQADFISSADGVQAIQNVESNKLDFAIVSDTKFTNYEGKENLKRGFGTGTSAFFNDLEQKKYTDGSKNDYLLTAAKALNDFLVKNPYKTWTNENMAFNGIRYNKLYSNEIVPFYRSMIMISGNEEQLNDIKKAWFEKDWNKFKSFGILHGKNSSGGSFKMPEELLQKHFSLENNKFDTLSNQIQSTPEYFKQQDGRYLGDDDKFHIAFDDEASFAWTLNVKSDSANPFYTPQKATDKLEIFALSDPKSYDIAIFRNDFSDDKINIIKQAFMNLSKAKQDTWGPEVGYNGYTD